MTQETKAKDCCYGVRPLSDCQCEKDRLSALAAEPSSLECQSEIDKDLVRAYYGDLGAFYRVRAALAATPAVGGEPVAWRWRWKGKLENNPWRLVFDASGISHITAETQPLYLSSADEA